MNIGDIYSNNFGNFIVTETDGKFVYYTNIEYGSCHGWDCKSFILYFVFNEKLTNEQTIKNIIE